MARNPPISRRPPSGYHGAPMNHNAPMSHDAPLSLRVDAIEKMSLESSGYKEDEFGQWVKQPSKRELKSCAVPSELSIEPHGQCLLGHKWRLDTIRSVLIAFFGVFFITLTFEYLRVLGKRLDNYIIARALRHSLDKPPPPVPKKVCSDPDCPFREDPSPQADDEKVRRGTGLLKYPDIGSGRKGYYVTETKLQLARALLYMMITTVGYMLVLFVVMTLNVIVFLAIMLGAAVGKFFTDWFKFDIVLSKSEAAPTPVAAVGEGVQTRGDREATVGRYS